MVPAGAAIGHVESIVCWVRPASVHTLFVDDAAAPLPPSAARTSSSGENFPKNGQIPPLEVKHSPSYAASG